MKSIKKVLALAIFIFFIQVSTLFAQDADFFATEIPGNVMFLVDNSGSMNTIMWHPSYDPNVTYPRRCNGTWGWDITSSSDPDGITYVGSNGGTLSACSKSVFFGSDDANCFEDIRINNNYLWWVFGNCADCATEDERKDLPKQTRIQVLKEVVVEVVDKITMLRVGGAKFFAGTAPWGSVYDPVGGYIFSKIGPGNAYPWDSGNYENFLTNHKKQFKTDLEKVCGEAWTPLAELFSIITWYFRTGMGNKNGDGYGVINGNEDKGNSGCDRQSPIDFYCQKSFVIIVTDGEPTMDDFDDFPNRPSWCESSGNSDYSYLCDYDEDNNEYLRRNDYPTEGTDNLDDWVKFGFDEDLMPGLYGDECGDTAETAWKQNLVTYVVGFAADYALLTESAANGGGRYYTAGTKDQLIDALTRAIADIVSRLTTFTAPTIPSVRSASEPLAAFSTASFIPSSTRPYWEGHLETFYVAQNGDVLDKAGDSLYDSLGNRRDDAIPIWDAADTVGSTSPRHVYTEIGGTLVDFSFSNLTNSILAVSNDTDRQTVIDYTLGGNKQNIAFGDVFHSNPLMIMAPSRMFRDVSSWVPDTENSYRRFADEYDHYDSTTLEREVRDRIILVGSNVGIYHALHAGTWLQDQDNPITGTPGDPYDESIMGGYFDGGTGEELWGFIPNILLPELKRPALNNAHEYFVDGSSSSANIWVDGVRMDSSGNPYINTSELDGEKHSDQWEEWRTIVVASLGLGGEAVFALDITDVKNPTFLWERSTANMGSMISSPEIGRVRLTDSSGGQKIEKWIAAYGFGQGATKTKGKGMEVVDLYTGQQMWSYVNDNVGDRKMIDCNFSAPINMADLNDDYYEDVIIAADECGQVWNIRLDGSYIDSDGDRAVDTASAAAYDATTGLVTGWGGHLMVDLGKKVSARPVMGFDLNRGLWVIVGTGDRDNSRDEKSTGDGIFLIRHVDHFVPQASGSSNPPVFKTLDVGDLIDTTDMDYANDDCSEIFTDPSDPVHKYGYYRAFDKGEKMITEPTLFSNHLLFTTFTPQAESGVSPVHANSSCGNGKNGCEACASLGVSYLYDLNFVNCGKGQIGEIPEVTPDPGDPTCVDCRGKIGSGILSVGVTTSSVGTQVVYGNKAHPVKWGMRQTSLVFVRDTPRNQ